MQGQGPTANQEADRNRKLCGSFENAAVPTPVRPSRRSQECLFCFPPFPSSTFVYLSSSSPTTHPSVTSSNYPFPRPPPEADGMAGFLCLA